MEHEIWKQVPRWENIYEVSNLGRVRRVAPVKGKETCRLMNFSDCGYGYKYVKFRFNGRSERPLVHRVVMEAFVGSRPSQIQVNHKDGIRSNNALSNLEYVTCSENHKHAYSVLGRTKTNTKGEKNGMAKLTSYKVEEIRRMYSRGGITQQKIADQYGVNQTMIGFIVRRANWT